MNSYSTVTQALETGARAQAVTLGFWQQRYVQNVLPILTSLLTHATIVLIGIMTYQVIKIGVRKSSTIVGGQCTIIPVGPTSPTLNGLGGIGTDPLHAAQQNEFPDVKDPGLALRPGPDLLQSLKPGGSWGDNGKALIIGVGGDKPLAPGNGHGRGTGKGDGTGPGEGINTGRVRRFGPTLSDGMPRHGDSPVFPPVAGNVVYICDATGSMMSEFDNLRVEVRRAVNGLRPTQAFNVIFFQENAPPPVVKNLLPAVPSCKQRVFDYVDKATARGPTDPIPAIRAAFAMKPDVIYFLCDPSDFPSPSQTIALFKSLNADHKCKVNTISFLDENHAGEDLLKQIAAESGGTFRYVAAEELGK